MSIRLEPKVIDRLSNIVETATIDGADFWGLYAEAYDSEFDETYWVWESDHPDLPSAYAAAVALGDPCPTIRADISAAEVDAA